ncbi:MAG: hypothetical protein ABI067_17820 [Leifsonia sp.]
MSDLYPEGVTARNIDRLDHDGDTKTLVVKCDWCPFEGERDAALFHIGSGVFEWVWDCPDCQQPNSENTDETGDES